MVAGLLACGPGCSNAQRPGATGGPAAPGRVLSDTEVDALVARAAKVTPVGEPIVVLWGEGETPCSGLEGGCIGRRASRTYLLRLNDGQELRLGISCEHEGCDPPEGCVLAGCNPLGADTCSPPLCTTGCSSAPKSCRRTVTQ
jgi:hypothetical protein